jgi:hypothetical protein
VIAGAGAPAIDPATGVAQAEGPSTRLARALRVLHDDDDLTVTAAFTGAGTPVAAATGPVDEPTAELIGYDSDGGPTLVAGRLQTGLVVAGDKEVRSLLIGNQAPRRGNFARLPGTDVPLVKGRLADGQEVVAVGSGEAVTDAID